MRQLTGLVSMGLLFMSAIPPKLNGEYYISTALGPHSWNHLIKIRRDKFYSEEWRTGFFDMNNQITTGTVRLAGDTLTLVPEQISFYVPVRFIKGKGSVYRKRTCACKSLVADTARIKSLRLNRAKELNQELCRKGYKFILVADSIRQISPGTKRVLHKQS